MEFSARIRSALFLGALISWSAVGPLSSASAAESITSSQITSPTDPTYVIYDRTIDGPMTQAFTVEGTVVGATSGYVDLRCYTGPLAGNYYTIVGNVGVTEARFSKQVYFVNFEPTLGPCVLRAVPHGDTNPHPPGSPDPFAGPHLLVSDFNVSTSEGTRYDYELEDYALGGQFEIESAWGCGLGSSMLFSADTLAPSEILFDCNADFYEDDPSASAPRASIQVDGANAYGPAGVQKLAGGVTIEQAVAVTKTFDAATGLAVLREIDPIVKCSPVSGCKEFVSTGVELERTWQLTNAGLVAWMTDTWRSTDGAAHVLSALYNQRTFNGPANGAYEFPGTGSFAEIKKDSTIDMPAGPGAIYYKENSPTPDKGDGSHPQGAIVYDISPSEEVAVYLSTKAGEGEEGENGFAMPYTRTIPAGGATTLRMTFVQSFSLLQVQALAGEALASYHPSLSITSPSDGASVSTSSVAVTGTASDSGQLTSLTVNGAAVAVGAGGSWSTTVALKPGTNTITAVAGDDAGLTASRSVSVTYTPPPPPSSPPALASVLASTTAAPAPPHASRIGAVKVGNESVSFTIACRGEAGSCAIESSLITTEKLKGNKITALAAAKARQSKANVRSKKVTVGSSKVVIAVGHARTITIRLNSTGRKLLAKFKKLPARLTVALVRAGKKTTIISQSVNVKPAKKRKAASKGKARGASGLLAASPLTPRIYVTAP